MVSQASQIPRASDAELARAILQAANAAGAHELELCKRFAPRIRLYGMKHLKDAQAAADLVQLTLEITVLKLRRREVHEPDHIASFVLGVARRQALAMRRQQLREEPATDELVELAGIRDTLEPGALDVQRLRACLEKLAERERSVVVLSYYAEHNAGEVAEQLATTSGNVRVIRHRAIERLQRCMGLEKEAS